MRFFRRLKNSDQEVVAHRKVRKVQVEEIEPFRRGLRAFMAILLLIVMVIILLTVIFVPMVGWGRILVVWHGGFSYWITHPILSLTPIGVGLGVLLNLIVMRYGKDMMPTISWKVYNSSIRRVYGHHHWMRRVRIRDGFAYIWIPTLKGYAIVDSIFVDRHFRSYYITLPVIETRQKDGNVLLETVKLEASKNVIKDNRIKMLEGENEALRDRLLNLARTGVIEQHATATISTRSE